MDLGVCAIVAVSVGVGDTIGVPHGGGCGVPAAVGVHVGVGLVSSVGESVGVFVGV